MRRLAWLLGPLAAAIIGLSFAAAAADASPVSPVFTVTRTGPLTDTFDATPTVCPWGFCSYSWTYFTATTNRLGVHMGDVQRFSYRFPSAGSYTVVLVVGVLCSPRGVRSCPGNAQTIVSVR